MTIWYTSDPHYYHTNVIKYCKRPFKDVEEMNEKLIHNWNSAVLPEDTVYCLGDFSLAFRPVELYSSRLLGTKKLVPGNHDWCHPANKKAKGHKLQKWIDKYVENGWEVLPIQTEVSIEGLGLVNLCHMPYKEGSTDERYQNFRMEDDGRVLICGHVHEKWQTKFTPKGTLMVNVGVDVHALKPVSQEALVKILSNAISKR